VSYSLSIQNVREREFGEQLMAAFDNVYPSAEARRKERMALPVRKRANVEESWEEQARAQVAELQWFVEDTFRQSRHIDGDLRYNVSISGHIQTGPEDTAPQTLNVSITQVAEPAKEAVEDADERADHAAKDMQED
jgi:hypothetical protein